MIRFILVFLCCSTIFGFSPPTHRRRAPTSLTLTAVSPSSYGDAVQIIQRARTKRRQDSINANKNDTLTVTATATATPLETIKKKKKPLPIVGYNGQDITYHYDRLPLVVAWRLNSLSLPLLGWYLQLQLDRFLHQDTLENIQRLRGQQLRQLFIQSQSVALIKSGQALSLRPDLIQNEIWAQELGKLVDEVGSFRDATAMEILAREWNLILPSSNREADRTHKPYSTLTLSSLNPIQRKTATYPVFQDWIHFENDNYAVASASIGQVYKARFTNNVTLLTSILGQTQAQYWQGKLVAIKIQRPDVVESASLDMYLLRRTAEWANKFRGGDLIGIADTFGMQLFGELDYIREAHNCQRFRDLYHGGDIIVPQPCVELTTKKVLVLEWIEGQKGPWTGKEGLDIVQMGLKCSVDQLLNTGLFHADPHRGNLLRTPEGKLAFIDFGMMADVTEEERYGLIGLAIGLQNKDVSLVTENLLKLGFLENTSQLDQLVPRLRQAFINSTGGTGKSSNVNFSRLQGELDAISRENNIKFKTPPFFTIILRSLTILEGFALSVDPNFRLVRSSYPYVLAQLVSQERDGDPPEALQQLLIRLLTVDGKGKEIEWERLRDFLVLARKAQQKYEPQQPATRTKELSKKDKSIVSRQTIDLLFRFLTSKTGLFLKKPLVHELAEIIDGMASVGEANLLEWSRGFLQPFPGGNGPVNPRRMEELNKLLETIKDALELSINISEKEGTTSSANSLKRLEYVSEVVRELGILLNDLRRRDNAIPLLREIGSVMQLVAVEVLEIRGSRAVRRLLQLT